jgi:hypothetical protein
LASRLEGKPFHLVASHCQNGNKDDVVAYVKSKGLKPDAPNFTVTSFGRHPGVKGNGYVPYYMVFDHTGKLAHHHMCGDYHGGDGLKMVEWVDDLLAKTPAIYLGDAPFEKEAALAKQIAKKKGLKGALASLDKKLADPELDEASRAELERLQKAVIDYRDRLIASAEALLATRPSEVLPALKDLAKEIKGTSIDAPVVEKVAEFSRSKDLKDAVAIEKKFHKAVRSLERRAPCEACEKKGLDGVNRECSACRDLAKSSIKKALKKLDAMIEGKESLPIAQTVKRYADLWR